MHLLSHLWVEHVNVRSTICQPIPLLETDPKRVSLEVPHLDTKATPSHTTPTLISTGLRESGKTTGELMTLGIGLADVVAIKYMFNKLQILGVGTTICQPIPLLETDPKMVSLEVSHLDTKATPSRTTPTPCIFVC